MDESHLSSDSSKGSAHNQNSHLYAYITVHFHWKEMFIELQYLQRLNTCSGYLWLLLKGTMSLTYDTDLPDFKKSTLDVLDVRQTLVQI